MMGGTLKNWADIQGLRRFRIESPSYYKDNEAAKEDARLACKEMMKQALSTYVEQQWGNFV